MSNNNLPQLVTTANVEFKKICTFFRINKLALHQGKSNFILFTNNKVREPINLYCDNNNEDTQNPALISKIMQITNSSNTPAAKFLGVYFDPNLNFKFHAEIVYLKHFTHSEWLKTY